MATGGRVLLAEQGLDAPDEVCLLVQRAPGGDEGPILRPGSAYISSRLPALTCTRSFGRKV
jgi:hypothetical protein